MPSKFLALIGGRIREIVATVTSAGAADDGKVVALGTDGRLDMSLMPVGLGADTKSIVASEALSAGDLVNVWLDISTFKVRKADATAAGKEAVGFVLAAVNQNSLAAVYFEGTITGLSGLIPSRMYLSTTPGAVTVTPPSNTGNVVQYIGYGVSATELSFEATDGVILA